MVKWIGSPNFTSGRQGTRIDRIVLHWIVGKISAADATFQDRARNTSAHYAVSGKDIHQYVREEDTAHHAGNWLMNLRSVGIEHEGGPNLPISDATYKTSGALIAQICQKYGIPIDTNHIILHKEIVATQCPGTLDRNRLIEEAKKASGESDRGPGLVITDQTKIDLGPEIGEMEVQAIKSAIRDLRRDKQSLILAIELAKQQREIKSNLITDQTKIYLGPELGYMEIQAVRSTLKDLRNGNQSLNQRFNDLQSRVKSLKRQIGSL